MKLTQITIQLSVLLAEKAPILYNICVKEGLIVIEKIIKNVLTEMTPHLTPEQLEHLGNVLYLNFHGKEIQEENTELMDTGVDGDEAKIRMFVASKIAMNRKRKTLQHYIKEVRNVLKFLGKSIDAVTGMDLRMYYGYMREKRGIKAVTMQTRLHYLSSFWDFLITEELVRSNPVRKVGTLKLEKEIKKPFSAEEMERLRDACPGVRDRAMIEFLYSTGVRVSEMVSLNIGDIEMGKQELIVYGKGSKERKTYITDSAKFYLKRYLKERDAKDSDPLFVTGDKPHGCMSVAGIQYMLRQLGKRAGVEKTHPHRFRRTIATDLLARGMPIEQVKEFLGHEKLDTTLIYCTVKSS